MKENLSCTGSGIYLLRIFETLGQKLEVLLSIFCDIKITREWITLPYLDLHPHYALPTHWNVKSPVNNICHLTIWLISGKKSLDLHFSSSSLDRPLSKTLFLGGIFKFTVISTNLGSRMWPYWFEIHNELSVLWEISSHLNIWNTCSKHLYTAFIHMLSFFVIVYSLLLMAAFLISIL